MMQVLTLVSSAPASEQAQYVHAVTGLNRLEQRALLLASSIVSTASAGKLYSAMATLSLTHQRQLLNLVATLHTNQQEISRRGRSSLSQPPPQPLPETAASDENANANAPVTGDAIDISRPKLAAQGPVRPKKGNTSERNLSQTCPNKHKVSMIRPKHVPAQQHEHSNPNDPLPGSSQQAQPQPTQALPHPDDICPKTLLSIMDVLAENDQTSLLEIFDSITKQQQGRLVMLLQVLKSNYQGAVTSFIRAKKVTDHHGGRRGSAPAMQYHRSASARGV